jgi:HlyD family secretion protein
MKKVGLFISVVIVLVFFSCKNDEQRADAYGNFEATSTIVSVESNGKLLFLDVEEGQTLEKGKLIALVDTTQLVLQKELLLSKIGAVKSKTQDPGPQIDVYKEQKQTLLYEKKRVENLLADNAATPKQLDDINANISIIEKQIQAAQRQANRANGGILSEIDPVRKQIDVIDEQIKKCYVYNPIKGTVLTKLAEPSEIVGFGKPLYRIANIETLTLRAYVSGTQLSVVKIGQQVEVLTDAPDGAMNSQKGTVSWVAANSEFTPKTIQTKEERVNLVYAVKIKVPNDGSLKIGMPAEVSFGGKEESEE